MPIISGFFNFLEASMATHGDDDLVAFFHGPQAVVVTVTPAAVEVSNNIQLTFSNNFVGSTLLVIKVMSEQKKMYGSQLSFMRKL